MPKIGTAGKKGMAWWELRTAQRTQSVDIVAWDFFHKKGTDPIIKQHGFMDWGFPVEATLCRVSDRVDRSKWISGAQKENASHDFPPNDDVLYRAAKHCLLSLLCCCMRLHKFSKKKRKCTISTHHPTATFACFNGGSEGGRRTLVSTPRTDLRVLETLCFLYLPSVEFLWANMIKLPGVLEIQDKPLEISSRFL